MTKSTKKLAMVLFLALMTVVMAACGNNSDNKKDVKAGTGEEGLKIAIVTSPSGVDDGSFNEDNYNGILNFIENNPTATVKAVKEPTGDPAAAVQAVADIVADYDVIVTPGFQFAGVSSIAVENPDKIFIMNDTEPTPVDGQTEFDNIYAFNFAEQESGFFAGMAAALETKTNKVAVVNGIAYPSNVNYQFGFESGVNYVNKVYGKNVELVELSGYAGTDVTGADVGGNYAGSFADEATGKVIGNALIKQGVDIIFPAAGGTGNGVFTAVKEAKGDVKVIGVDVDQYDDGANGSENIVLTSGVKFMAMNIEKVLNSVADGTFKGGNVVLYADTDSTGFIKEEGRHQLSADTLNKLNEAYELVKDGTIVPASNFNEHSPEQFPGL
ncbi:BMP family ABC transporter substrate-binding protein [Sporosarcina sp. ACRSL]|uniref:BMP family lipoprotein n=1 Tax=Sporosarcina sp. ACRSL TaxID=2918215 RepID=UPI001EF6E6EF|nr:BMP family ABC transporter substrate-binding protein [Sporosarcina sp. ACRSL]MCG7346156.1 BMP family ABC transporter substrate-binding protein [Sporosarcina sp. ACRSL]